MRAETDWPKSGALWGLVQERAARALSDGALLPIPTTVDAVEQGGIRFEVRTIDSLRRKEAAQRAASAYAETSGGRVNPFLPYDPALFVCQLGPRHVCLLNKFNILEGHILMVTRDFEAQRTLLTVADFEVLWRCLQEVAGLAFYNGGPEAGASQTHKHMQLVPLPLTDDTTGVPVEAALGEADTFGSAGRVDLPFPHALTWLPPTLLAAEVSPARTLRSLYLKLLTSVELGVGPRDQEQAGPYNLLVTRRWMMVVPRTREHYAQISVNALGFAGSLLVRDAGELSQVSEAGPVQILQSVSSSPALAKESP